MNPPAVEFPFPYEPYSIQLDFMKTVYSSIEERKIAVMESPTGTGKSLSLLIGSLKWLFDDEERERERVGNQDLQNIQENISMGDDEPDWVREFAAKKVIDEEKQKYEEKQAKKAKLEERLKKRRTANQQTRGGTASLFIKNKKRKIEGEGTGEGEPAVEDADEELVVADYESDGDVGSTGMRQLPLLGDEEEEGESKRDGEEVYQQRKIFYCSRTHSQLAQFIRELKKTVYGSKIRCVSLGSRKNLCINKKVSQNKSVAEINDRCLELQKNKSKSTKKGDSSADKKGCPHLDRESQEELGDQVLNSVMDIEQIVEIAVQQDTCPYYATRTAIPAAHVVVLPYQMLLHKTTREALGIQLEGNIVIIDEAHNLIDTVTEIHSTTLSLPQITRCRGSLAKYLTKYQARLKGKNIVYIRQLLFILDSFTKCLQPPPPPPPSLFPKAAAAQNPPKPNTVPDDRLIFCVNDFLMRLKIDNINFHKIITYLQVSSLAKKLNGFVEKYEAGAELEIHPTKDIRPQPQQGDPQQPQLKMTSPLFVVEPFLQHLANNEKDGRVLIQKEGDKSVALRYLLLNPCAPFAELVKEARSVIMAGGTMQPTSDFHEQLFPASPDSDVRLFSCGHVIPASNLLVASLNSGPAGMEFSFTFQERKNMEMLDELGRTLVNMVRHIPAGVVCFFPSFAFVTSVTERWRENGILESLKKKKRVFVEPRETNQVEQTLANYEKFIKLCQPSSSLSPQIAQQRAGMGITEETGALLFSVVGGKMSEGINFSDDLGRCVIVVGMPYPNLYSPELVEKMRYLDSTSKHPRQKDELSSGEIYYENLCMKAVNQSIGRAIRHINDYAVILLLDKRYSKPRIQGKLPKWIGDRLLPSCTFPVALRETAKFFKGKKEQAS